MTDRLTFDVAAESDIGARSNQQDYFAFDFSSDANAGIAVLSDGMGGYKDGVAAAKFLVTGVAGELLQDLDTFQENEDQLPQRLSDLTHEGNSRLGDFIRQRTSGETIGATLVSVAISQNHLYWASVGDSPLYLFRNGVLSRLNQDHSMSQQIDFMIEAGMISAEKGRDHPDRSLLTSAIFGKEISKIDVPDTPFVLQEHDILLLASDGINTIGQDAIEDVLRRSMAEDSEVIVDALFAALDEIGADDQDNASLIVIKSKVMVDVVKQPPPTPRLSPEDAARLVEMVLAQAQSGPDDALLDTEIPELTITQTEASNVDETPSATTGITNRPFPRMPTRRIYSR
ncbi:protein phosphatase 2C domain-containing protein [Rhodobacteraceae bacterium]|nr:protein phosphatase 2C domain-containing protein [Paracoccaceae bacterium]